MKLTWMDVRKRILARGWTEENLTGLALWKKDLFLRVAQQEKDERAAQEKEFGAASP